MSECDRPRWAALAEQVARGAWAHKKKLAGLIIVAALVAKGMTPAEAVRMAVEILTALAGLG
jgi:hypothetical protein